MDSYISSIINFKNSILGKYITDYDNYWEIIADLKSLIIKVGKNLDKEKYEEKYPNVWISKSAIIDERAKIIGPCIIDENAEIRINTFIRGGVVIGKGCVVGNSSEIKNAVLFDEAKIPHFNYIGDSIIGYKAHFGAGAITSNIKSDESTIKLRINNNTFETNKRKLGSLVGDFVEIGCNCVLNPGVIIGSNTNIYPLVMVRGEIGKNKIVKSMDNIVEKV